MAIGGTSAYVSYRKTAGRPGSALATTAVFFFPLFLVIQFFALWIVPFWNENLDPVVDYSQTNLGGGYFATSIDDNPQLYLEIGDDQFRHSGMTKQKITKLGCYGNITLMILDGKSTYIEKASKQLKSTLNEKALRNELRIQNESALPWMPLADFYASNCARHSHLLRNIFAFISAFSLPISFILRLVEMVYLNRWIGRISRRPPQVLL